MRAIIAGLAGTLFATNAMAADYLRGGQYEGGSASYNWAGVYIGAQIGYSESNVDFSKSTRDMVANLMRFSLIENEFQVSNWSTLPRRDARATTYGGFIGYNSQWGDVVFGLDGTYSHTDLPTTSSDLISRRVVLSNNIQSDTSVFSAATMRITDYGTIRVRAGYAMNWVLPYLTAGVAIGRADVTRSVLVTSINRVDLSTTPSTPLGDIVDTASESANGQFAVGYSAGLGVDIGLFPGAFVRGEYEFIQLNTVKGMTAHLNTFRVGAAFKF
jgi:outer membrane immunogenic protein